MDTKKLLIVFPYRDENQFKSYRTALDHLLNDSNVRELNIIVVIPDSVKKESLTEHKLIAYLSPKDISLFGKVKDEKFNNIAAQPYDTFLWFEENNSKISKLLAGIHAKWKIGINSSLDNFTIQTNCKSENPGEMVNFAKNTLEKITVNNLAVK